MEEELRKLYEIPVVPSLDTEKLGFLQFGHWGEN